MKRGDELCEGAGRLAVEESNHWHGRLLGVRHERPCRHAAEEGDEFPSLQWIELHSVPCQPDRRISN
jgi:hypothetical protein